MRRSARALILVTLAMVAGVVAPGGAGEPQEPFGPALPPERLDLPADPIDLTIALSQLTFPETASAPSVILTRDDAFPDALAAAPLAGIYRAPILNTTGGGPRQAPTLPDRVLEEMNRVTGGPQGCEQRPLEVIILGGTAAVSQVQQDRLEQLGWCVDRIAGASRFETAALIGERVLGAQAEPQPDPGAEPPPDGGDGGSEGGSDVGGPPAGGGPSTGGGPTGGGFGPDTAPGFAGTNANPLDGTVFVARADNPADSATIGALLAALPAPLVVSTSDELHEIAQAFIRDRDFERAVLIGGPAALDDRLEEQLATSVPTVQRVFGASRDATSVAIADQLWPRNLRRGHLVINGFEEGFWRLALGGAPFAARRGLAPIYTGRFAPPDLVRDHLATFDPPVLDPPADPQPLFLLGGSRGSIFYSPGATLEPPVDPPLGVVFGQDDGIVFDGLDGTGPRVLFDGLDGPPRDIVINPDGLSSLAVGERAPMLVISNIGLSGEGPLQELPVTATNVFNPQLSPDGSLLAFTSCPNPDFTSCGIDVWRVDRDDLGSSEPATRGFQVDDDGTFLASRFAWAPDGRALVVNTLDSRILQLVVAPDGLIEPDPLLILASAVQALFQPPDDLLALIVLLVLSIDGSATVFQGGEMMAEAPAVFDSSPTWSGDGDWILGTKDDAIVRCDLWLSCTTTVVPEGVRGSVQTDQTGLRITGLDGQDQLRVWQLDEDGALRDIELTVTDHEPGRPFAYTGSCLGRAAPAILDTQAFVTCP